MSREPGQGEPPHPLSLHCCTPWDAAFRTSGLAVCPAWGDARGQSTDSQGLESGGLAAPVEVRKGCLWLSETLRGYL